MRSEPRPGWGTLVPPKAPCVPFRGLCPAPSPPAQWPIWLVQSVPREAGTPGGPGTSVRSPPSSASSGTGSRGPALGGLGPACQCRERRRPTHLSPTAAGRPRPRLPSGQGEGLRSRSRALRCWAKGRAVYAEVVGGVGSQLGAVRRLRGSHADQGLCQRHPRARGAPDLVQNSLSEGDRAERSRKANRLSGAAAHPGRQYVRQVPGPWGDTCALMRKRILELGLAVKGVLAAPSVFPSTSRFGEDFRAVLFSALPSIFIFQGSDSSRALGVEIRWRDQITVRLCVRCACVTEMARECAVSQ